MKLEGKRIAVLAENMYEDLELWYPVLRFREEGAEVVVVGSAVKTFESKHGLPVTADLAAEDAKASQFDAVVIPGGYAPDMMRRHPPMVKLVRDAYDQGKIVAAICHAGWVLASAGIVKGKTMTSFFSIKDDMVHAGAEWVDKPVVRDGNLITSRMPKDLGAFCREIIAALA